MPEETTLDHLHSRDMTLLTTNSLSASSEISLSKPVLTYVYTNGHSRDAEPHGEVRVINAPLQ
jgi:hypothetical protein